MTKFPLRSIEEIYSSDISLANFSEIFDHLKLLNQILNKIVPAHLLKLCHIGAFHPDTSTIVLFVNDQQALHICKNMSNQILQGLAMHGQNFNHLLIKVKPTT